MDGHPTYNITYLGIGGSDERQTHRGDHHSLAEIITIIEESGGQQITATREIDDQVVYDCGGFVV